MDVHAILALKKNQKLIFEVVLNWLSISKYCFKSKGTPIKIVKSASWS